MIDYSGLVRALCDQGTEDQCMQAADAIEALQARVKVLEGALKQSKQGWDNALELGLLPERHRETAQQLAETARVALGDA